MPPVYGVPSFSIFKTVPVKGLVVVVFLLVIFGGNWYVGRTVSSPTVMRGCFQDCSQLVFQLNRSSPKDSAKEEKVTNQMNDSSFRGETCQACYWDGNNSYTVKDTLTDCHEVNGSLILPLFLDFIEKQPDTFNINNISCAFLTHETISQINIIVLRYGNIKTKCVVDLNSQWFERHRYKSSGIKCHHIRSERASVNGGVKFLITVMMSVSIVINTVTFTVFCLLSQLRSGYGQSLMNYVAARALKTLATQVYYTSWFDDLYYPCVGLGATIQFLEIASRAWQVVIAHQLWTAFSSGDLSSLQAIKSYKVYYGLAWGAPFTLATLTVAIDLSPGVPGDLRPRYALPVCWYNNIVALYLLFVVPAACGELTNLACCIVTLRRLASFKVHSKSLRGQRHNARQIRWSSVYMKVSVVLGMGYMLFSSLVLFSWTSPTADSFKYAVETVMHMRGVEVFFIFVLNKRTLSLLARTLWATSSIDTFVRPDNT